MGELWFEARTVFDGSDGSIPVVVVAGEVDLATAPRLEGELHKALTAGSRQVVVDMGAVEFIDASGIGALLRAAEAARTDGARLAVRHPSRAVRRLMDILSLDGALPVDDAPGATP